MKQKQSRKQQQVRPTVRPKQPAVMEKKVKKDWHMPALPIIPIFFVAIYLWAAWYYGDAFRMARERSFWVPETGNEGMGFLVQQQFGYLWYIGRLLLTTFRYPWVGGLLLAALLTFDTWAIGYVLRLSPKWRFLQYIPAGIYMMMVTFEGVNTFSENEGGLIFGNPLVVAVIFGILSIVVRCVKGPRTSAPQTSENGEPKPLKPIFQLLEPATLIVIFALSIGYTQAERPYTRVLASEQLGVIDQDWQKIIDVAHEHDALSYRPLAAAYAIALVHTDQLNEKLYDIRLDYDSIYTHSRTGVKTDGLTLYVEDCDFHAGLIQTCIHHAVERITMIGPNIHSLELLVKCHLMTSEWEVAKKYLHILSKVPFEGDFVEKYTAMLNNEKMVNTDPEIAVVRLTEPIHDSFENTYQQPTFMGYNAQLSEGRSINALYESLACCLYTKLMPGFMMRMQPLDGKATPTIISDALCIMSNKNPDILRHFPNLSYNKSQLITFLTAVGDKIKATGTKTSAEVRAENARALFDTYKGYYPYYYFFGNLKATKKHSDHGSSGAGVN